MSVAKRVRERSRDPVLKGMPIFKTLMMFRFLGNLIKRSIEISVGKRGHPCIVGFNQLTIHIYLAGKSRFSNG